MLLLLLLIVFIGQSWVTWYRSDKKIWEWGFFFLLYFAGFLLSIFKIRHQVSSEPTPTPHVTQINQLVQDGLKFEILSDDLQEFRHLGYRLALAPWTEMSTPKNGTVCYYTDIKRTFRMIFHCLKKSSFQKRSFAVQLPLGKSCPHFDPLDGFCLRHDLKTANA